MDALIALYSKENSSRFIWAARVFFKHAMRCDLKIYYDLDDFSQAEGVRVNYSPDPIDHSFHISPHGLLWENEIVEQEFSCSSWDDLEIFCARRFGDLLLILFQQPSF